MSDKITSIKFQSVCEFLFKYLEQGEHLFINFSGEESHFLRINNAKVRQTGIVQDGVFKLILIRESTAGLLKMSTEIHVDSSASVIQLQEKLHLEGLKSLQMTIGSLPVDPFAQLPKQLPKQSQNSNQASKGSLIAPQDVVKTIFPLIQNLDLAGIWASGPLYRAMAHSGGMLHWFETETFSLDYSLYTKGQRAVKGCYGGSHFDLSAFEKSLDRDRAKISFLHLDTVKLPKGNYRTFLEPAAFGEVIQMLCHGAMSEAAIRRAGSPLRRVRQGEAKFSELFNLSEDFTGGETHRFNRQGELAPQTLDLVKKGQLVDTLISSRTEKEYTLKANGANDEESMQAPSVSGGMLSSGECLQALDRGLYLSNLHYLNWSDLPQGRITGMTRFACFWVENGKIKGPIENLRFDDTIFNLLGTELESLTHEVETSLETMTYEMRHPGVLKNPGALVKSMQFTL